MPGPKVKSPRFKPQQSAVGQQKSTQMDEKISARTRHLMNELQRKEHQQQQWRQHSKTVKQITRLLSKDPTLRKLLFDQVLSGRLLTDLKPEAALALCYDLKDRLKQEVRTAQQEAAKNNPANLTGLVSQQAALQDPNSLASQNSNMQAGAELASVLEDSNNAAAANIQSANLVDDAVITVGAEQAEALEHHIELTAEDKQAIKMGKLPRPDFANKTEAAQFEDKTREKAFDSVFQSAKSGKSSFVEMMQNQSSKATVENLASSQAASVLVAF